MRQSVASLASFYRDTKWLGLSKTLTPPEVIYYLSSIISISSSSTCTVL
jgi:hypothetical protein